MPEHAEAIESTCEPRRLISLYVVAAASPACQSPQEESFARRAEARGHRVSLIICSLPSPAQ